MKNIHLLFLLIFGMLIFFACKKEEQKTYVDASANLALDSITTTKKHIVVWEEILVTAHTRGENIEYQWQTNHGTMANKDSSTVRYWGCPSCEGLNTIKCILTNSYGSVFDTIMVQVD